MLLSPGPANEAYFEHAYLANYLGYTLVEGGDLTVRNNRVWLSQSCRGTCCTAIRVCYVNCVGAS